MLIDNLCILSNTRNKVGLTIFRNKYLFVKYIYIKQFCWYLVPESFQNGIYIHLNVAFITLVLCILLRSVQCRSETP